MPSKPRPKIELQSSKPKPKIKLEIIEAETENDAIVYCGAEPEKVYEDVAEGSLKVEKVQD